MSQFETIAEIDQMLGPLTQKNQRRKPKHTFAKKAFRKTVGDMRREEPFPYKSFFFNPKLNRRAQRKPVPGILQKNLQSRKGRNLRMEYLEKLYGPPTEYPQSSADDDDPLQNMPVGNRKNTKRKRMSPVYSSSSSPYVSNEEKSPHKPTQQSKKRQRASLSPLSRKLKKTMAAL
jgi:hypothetical protein